MVRYPRTILNQPRCMPHPSLPLITTLDPGKQYGIGRVSWSRLTCHVPPFAEARAEIAGPSEKFVRPGSTLQLHCLVKKSTETPSYLFWYHNFRMINYDVDQGVNVSTDLVGRESWLEVPRASDRHSGNYTCEASNAQPARVLVHVFKGDNPAAMQHSIASSPSVMACSALLMMFTTLKLVFHSTTTN